MGEIDGGHRLNVSVDVLDKTQYQGPFVQDQGSCKDFVNSINFSSI